jgi:hypothetical protein
VTVILHVFAAKLEIYRRTTFTKSELFL